MISFPGMKSEKAATDPHRSTLPAGFGMIAWNFCQL
jgi:hypothetical protein